MKKIMIYKKFGRKNNLMKNIGNIKQLESTKNTESYIERDIKNAKEFIELKHFFDKAIKLIIIEFYCYFLNGV